MSLLARRYATALFEVAESRAETAKVLADLDGLHELFGSGQGHSFLTDPTTARAKVDELLQRALAGSSELTRNVAAVVRQRRRESLLPLLAAELRAMVRAKAGEEVAVVETARPLGQDEQDALRGQIARLTGKRIVLEMRKSPDILGGVRVRVGNTLYDGSLLGELLDLQQKLLRVPVTRT